MLLNLEEILKPAVQHNFAVGAFNVTESTMFQAIVEKAEELKAPVIIQVSPNEFAFSEKELYLYFTERLKKSTNPFALHYDHSKSFAGCAQAMQAGFTSVMYDGSRLTYQENVDNVRKVVELAHALGVSVEGEIGAIGETQDFDAGIVTDMIYTKPEDAVRFVKDTGVDALAVSIGTVHGLIPKGYTPKLQLDLLREIAKATEAPLVLHGGSGTPEDAVAQACRSGIHKVNISSEFKHAYYQSVKEFITANPTAVSPTLTLKQAVQEVKKVVERKLNVFGAVGMSKYYEDAKPFGAEADECKTTIKE